MSWIVPSGVPRLILLLLIAFHVPAVSAPAAPDTTWIEAAGAAAVYGGDVPSARNRAIESAKRNAVEKGLGVVVAAQTLVRNYQLVSDRILSRATGYVGRYEVTDEARVGDEYQVKIRAKVAEIIDQVLADRLALELLLDWVHHPRIMVLIRENNMGDTESRVAESVFIRTLIDKGFEPAERGRVESSQYWGSGIDFYDDPAAAGRLGADAGAELAVIGYARSDSGGDFYGLLSGQAKITARVVRTDTREVLSSNEAEGKAVHISKTVAGAKAIEQAADRLLPDLYRDIIRAFSTESSGIVMVRLVISPLEFEQLEAIEQYLGLKIGGVAGVDRRSYRLKEAELDVRYEGRPEDLTGALRRFRYDGLGLSVVSISSRVIELRLEELN